MCKIEANTGAVDVIFVALKSDPDAVALTSSVKESGQILVMRTGGTLPVKHGVRYVLLASCDNGLQDSRIERLTRNEALERNVRFPRDSGRIGEVILLHAPRPSRNADDKPLDRVKRCNFARKSREISQWNFA